MIALLTSLNTMIFRTKMEINGNDELKSPLLQPSDVTLNADRTTKSIMFKVSGIECASCATSIESALEKLSGVESVMVSPLQGQAVVRYIPEQITVSCTSKTFSYEFISLCVCVCNYVI